MVDLRPIAASLAEVPLRGTVLRLVQQQGIDSLAPLANDLSQLARLEALVDASKPPLDVPGSEGPTHTLITTPFRYPPLRHGSRFSSRLHRGLFYGSRSREGSLVEVAFYGLLFWEGLSSPPPVPIRRRQTLFSVELGTARGLQLQAIADSRTQAVLRDPAVYGPTQQLGEWMREQGIEAFEYLSARSSRDLLQVGVFTPHAFQSTPFDQVEITTEITGAHVSFLCHDDGQLHRYPRELFLIKGQLPMAAG